MTDSHEPRPEFVEFLERQVRRQLRRQERFAPEARRTPPPRNVSWWRRRAVRTAALVVVSVLVGYAGATAAQDASERRARELLELQANARLEMARLEASFAADRLVAIETRVGRGEAPEQELGRATLQRAFSEREVAAAELDLQELEATGRPPRNDLGAPLVSGRDLVGARLRLRLEALRDERTHAAREVEQLAAGVDAGRYHPFDLRLRRLDLERLERQLASIRRTLQLRESLLAGEIQEAEARQRQALLEARMDVEDARADLELARARAERMLDSPDHEEIQRLGAEYELRMAEVRAEMTELRLRILREQSSVEE